MATFSTATAVDCPDASRLTKDKRTEVGKQHNLKVEKQITTYPGWASGDHHHGIIVTVLVVAASCVVIFIWWK